MQIGDAVLKFVWRHYVTRRCISAGRGNSAAKPPRCRPTLLLSMRAWKVWSGTRPLPVRLRGAGAEGDPGCEHLSEAQTKVARLTYENQVAQNSLRARR